MAAKYTIKGNTGESAARDLMIAYLNTGTSSAPVWSPMGRTVEDSSVEYDYSQETKTDILGETHVTAKTPTATQTFSGNNLIAGDAVLNHILDMAIVRRSISEALNQDILIAHLYLTDTEDKPFAERWKSSSVLLTTNGGAGGDMLASDIEVTYGGERETGTISKGSGGAIEFTADT
jgi:hypothetical protein